VVLLDWAGKAVLDKETGLVWERSPAITNNFTWQAARDHCLDLVTVNRKGWRLPSIHELASLPDPSVAPGPKLPPGHPFPTVQSASYWSATTEALNPFVAWREFFEFGAAGTSNKTNHSRAWCVRGGLQADQY
jgi:hypothetical protein